MSVIDKLAEAGYLSDEQVSRVQDNARAFVEALEADPVLRKEAEMKLAAPVMMGAMDDIARSPSFMDVLKKGLKYTGAGALLAGGALAGEAAVRHGFQAIHGALTKGKYYKQMIEANPDLGEENAKHVQRAFNTLHKFNPEFASDPLVAGGYVRSAVQMGQFPAQTARELVSARKDMASTRSGSFDPTRVVQVPQESPDRQPHPSQVEAWQAQSAKAMSDIESRKEAERQARMSFLQNQQELEPES